MHPHRTRLKICGLTREADVDVACEVGADAVGFVLWPGSARAVGAARAGVLARRLPPFVTPVLLFVNADRDTLARAFDAVPHALAQFHGDETPSQCAAAGRPYLRAARMAPGARLLDFAAPYVDLDAAQRPTALLLDAHVDGYGGGGKVFDWSLVPARGVPLPVVLSGGLHAGNVADGVAALRPWGVDVSSGVEAEAKGLKDAARMRAFAAALRDADARLTAATSEPPAGPRTCGHDA